MVGAGIFLLELGTEAGTGISITIMLNWTFSAKSLLLRLVFLNGTGNGEKKFIMI